MSDVHESVCDRAAHRPWPLPRGPWLMKQTWHDLLFAHWPLPPETLREKVPAPLPLDLFDGHAWLGIVPFRMTNVAPRGVPPIPFVSDFPELNVRTYVTLEGKPGVYFFSLDAGSAFAVAAARLLFGLPYYRAAMTVSRAGASIVYESRRRSDERAVFRASYRPAGPVEPPEPGTLEYFLTERYCLYTVDAAAAVHRLEIHHPRWPLQRAEAEIGANTMADAAGIRLPPVPPLLHVAARQDVVLWGRERVRR